MESEKPGYVEIIETLIARAEARGKDRVVIPEHSGKEIIKYFAIQEWARNPECPLLEEAVSIVQGEQPVMVTSLRSLMARGSELGALNRQIDKIPESLLEIEQRLAELRGEG